MSWKLIRMRYPGICVTCGKQVDANEMGMWMSGQGVKHESCVELQRILCLVCGAPVGCIDCEFREECDIPNVSEYCICRRCIDRPDPLGLYGKAALKKFPALGT